MSMSHDEAIASMLIEGADDWVPLQSLIWHGTEVVERTGVSLETAVTDLLVAVGSAGLMRVGELTNTGFELWPEAPDYNVSRVLEECRHFDWSPLGDGCWLANTTEGNRLAAEYLAVERQHPSGPSVPGPACSDQGPGR